MSGPTEVIRLVRQWVEKAEEDFSEEEQEGLTDYAVVSRYPGDQEPISMEEARQAVRLARRVRRALRKHLPKEALRKRSG